MLIAPWRVGVDDRVTLAAGKRCVASRDLGYAREAFLSAASFIPGPKFLVPRVNLGLRNCENVDLVRLRQPGNIGGQRYRDVAGVHHADQFRRAVVEHLAGATLDRSLAHSADQPLRFCESGCCST